MSREQNIPLLLWISTAILAHIASGGGAVHLARVIEDRSELQYFARSIRGRLQPPQAIEVAFESLPVAPEEPADPSSDSRPRDTLQPEKKEKKAEPPAPEKKPDQKKIVLPPMVATPAPPPEAKPPPQMD